MSSTDHIRSLIQEAAPLLQLQEVLESTEDPGWSLEWDDGLLMVVDHDDADQRVTLTSHIGPMPEDDHSRLATLMLQYNGLWHQTGGVRLGLDEDNIVQIYDFSAAGLDVPSFCGLLASFAEKARAWTELVERRADAPEPSSENSSHSILDMLSSGIRA